MQITLQIPSYKKEKGLEYSWEYNFVIKTNITMKTIMIKANKEGLISLAKQLLTLAQDEVPLGTHIHLDKYNSLEDNSNELIIEKQ